MPLFGPPNLSRLKAAKDIYGLMRALGYTHDNGQTCMAAIQALAEIGPAAVQPLLRSLADSFANVRFGAAEALGRIGDRRAVVPLLPLLHDPDALTRRAVVAALGRLQDPQAVPVLIQVFDDPESRVREAAILALGQIGDPRAIQPLLVTFERNDYNLRMAATRALTAIGKPAVAALIAAANHHTEELRLAAITALTEIGDEAAIPTLVNALLDPDESIARAAKEGLARFDAAATPALVQVFQSGDEAHSSAAAKLLAGAILPSARSLLANLIHSPQPKARERLASFLGSISAEWAQTLLSTLLQDSDTSVRYIAAQSLASARTLQPVRPLFDAVKDADPYVRDAALNSLEHIARNTGSLQLQQTVDQLKNNPTKVSTASNQANRLIDDLVRLGSQDPFVGTETGLYDSSGRHIQARQIGQQLNQLGGYRLVQIAIGIIRRELGTEYATELGFIWTDFLV